MDAIWALLLEFATDAYNAQILTFALHVKKISNINTTFWKWKNMNQKFKKNTKIVNCGKLENTLSKESNQEELLPNPKLKAITKGAKISE